MKQISKIISEINFGIYNNLLRNIYIDNAIFEPQKKRWKIIETFMVITI